MGCGSQQMEEEMGQGHGVLPAVWGYVRVGDCEAQDVPKRHFS